MYTVKVELENRKEVFKNRTAEHVLNTIKWFSPKDFWDDAINDDHEFFDCTLYGTTYTAAQALKVLNNGLYVKKCDEFWEEAKQDFIDEIEDIKVGETRTVFGFEVTKEDDEE